MDQSQHLSQLIKVTDNTGLTGGELKAISGMNTETFDAAALELWNDRALIGAKEIGCCGNRCGTYCVAYMKPNQIWYCAPKPADQK